MRMTQLPPILTASEVAALFRVDPRTVGRWADDGKLIHTRTPGGKNGKGHRRYPSAQPLIQQHLAVVASAGDPQPAQGE
jgi:hypothetical protein